MTKTCDYFETEVVRKKETNKCWGCDAGMVDFSGNAVLTWLPKKEVQCFPQENGTTIIKMPRWLAKDRGLL